MAQLSSNSQRTAGIESGGTQSATLQLLRETSAYATMLVRALRELERRQKEKDKDKEEQSEQDSKQSNQLSIRQEDDRPQLGGRSHAQVEGTEQRRLTPGEDEPDDPSYKPLSAEEVGISRKDKLSADIHVGDYRIKGSYAELSDRWHDIPVQQQQAIATALAGDIPEQEVSIKVKDEFDNQSEFFADTAGNQGWKVSNNPAENLSTHDIEQDLQRQKSSGAQKIKRTMQSLKPEGGPDLFRGQNLTVLTDGDEVIVVDVSSGIIRDVDRLDEIGNRGEQAVQDSAIEAAGAFGIKGGAAQGIPASKAQKQRELTP